MKVISTEKIPIKMWLENIEDGALKQAINLANLPFAFRHIALMPDCHGGFGMPIGGVLLTEDAIIPNAIGVDIGCGMNAMKTSLTEINTETIKKIMNEIRNQIPLGFERHKEEQNKNLMPEGNLEYEEIVDIYFKDMPICKLERINARYQLGSLGGGNHFLEIQKGSDGYIWAMIHSGSRNLGKKVADYYNKIAIELNEKWHSKVPKEWELAFLPIDSEECQSYLKEMQYCVDFAFANRKLMMNKIKKILDEILPNPVQFDDQIDVAHNYVKLENHFGENVWVHRKGAISAKKGSIGIIPGSMGTKSYIVEGLGNAESFMSASHGAGRIMGRKKAKENLNLKEEIKKLDDQGIIHGMRNIENLDEASGAYKPIAEIMENQKDLVKILTELTPVANIKG